jgi:hypothetical protein
MRGKLRIDAKTSATVLESECAITNGAFAIAQQATQKDTAGASGASHDLLWFTTRAVLAQTVYPRRLVGCRLRATTFGQPRIRGEPCVRRRVLWPLSR